MSDRAGNADKVIFLPLVLLTIYFLAHTSPQKTLVTERPGKISPAGRSLPCQISSFLFLFLVLGDCDCEDIKPFCFREAQFGSFTAAI